MTDFFEMFAGWWRSLWGLLDSVTFEVNGMTVSYGGMIFALLATGMVISIFWRGAKT